MSTTTAPRDLSEELQLRLEEGSISNPQAALVCAAGIRAALQRSGGPTGRVALALEAVEALARYHAATISAGEPRTPGDKRDRDLLVALEAGLSLAADNSIGSIADGSDLAVLEAVDSALRLVPDTRAGIIERLRPTGDPGLAEHLWRATCGDEVRARRCDLDLDAFRSAALAELRRQLAAAAA